MERVGRVRGVVVVVDSEGVVVAVVVVATFIESVLVLFTDIVCDAECMNE